MTGVVRDLSPRCAWKVSTTFTNFLAFVQAYVAEVIRYNKVIMLNCCEVAPVPNFQWQWCNKVIVVSSEFNGPGLVERHTLTFMSVFVMK